MNRRAPGSHGALRILLVLGLLAALHAVACSSKVVNRGSGSSDEDDMAGSGGSSTGTGGSSSTEAASSTTAMAAGSTVMGAGTASASGGGGSGGAASSTETTVGAGGGSTGMETTASAGGTSASECPANHRCVPEVPAGWQGPVVVLDKAGSSPDCPPEFPTLEFDANDVPVAGGGCTCNCSVASATCHDPEFEEFESESVCTGEALSAGIVSRECREPDAGVFLKLTLPRPDIICTSSVEEAFEPAEFAWAYRACSGAVTVGSCDAGSCLPLPSAPYHTTHCVYREGEHQCPAAFPRQSLRFQSIEDTRFCEDECDCQPASGSGRGACTTTMQVYSEGCGELLSTFTLDDSRCLSIPGIAADVPEYQSGSARCQSDPPPVSGALTGADVTTACCTN